MKFTKKESIGSFLKKGDDIKNGDTLIILDEGKKIEGEYGLQNVFTVKTVDGKEGNVTFNQTSINNLIDGYGDDSKEWINKDIKTEVIKQNVQGKLTNVYYFLHPKAELNEKTGLFEIMPF
jgi:hypothetical protein